MKTYQVFFRNGPGLDFGPMTNDPAVEANDIRDAIVKANGRAGFTHFSRGEEYAVSWVDSDGDNLRLIRITKSLELPPSLIDTETL